MKRRNHHSTIDHLQAISSTFPVMYQRDLFDISLNKQEVYFKIFDEKHVEDEVFF